MGQLFNRLTGQSSFKTLLTLICCLFPAICIASSETTEPQDTLPGSDSLSFQPIQADTVIDCDNAGQYREHFVPEIFELICSDLGSLKTAERLRYAWRLDDSFEAATAMRLSEDFSLGTPKELSRGFPFGRVGDIESSIPDPHSNRKLGASLLWNANSHFWSNKITWSAISVAFRGNDVPQRNIAGEIKRVYPKALSNEDRSEQLLREIVRLKEPSAISGLAFLTFRFTGTTEDFLWLYSPAISAVRQLTGHNRSDSILRSAMSLDDIFLWSGKNESLDPIISGTTTALVPFPSLSASRLSIDSFGCYETENQLSGSPLQRRADLRGYWENTTQTLNPIVPEGLTFVPRKLIRLDVTSRDPYSQYGRQVIYLDHESQLPVFKIVFDQSGSHWKTLIQVNGFGTTDNLSYKTHVPVFTLIFDKLNQSSAVIRYSDTRYCSSFDNLPFSLEDFSPARIQPPAAPARE